jgi:hypothetical protein
VEMWKICVIFEIVKKSIILMENCKNFSQFSRFFWILKLFTISKNCFYFFTEIYFFGEEVTVNEIPLGDQRKIKGCNKNSLGE